MYHHPGSVQIFLATAVFATQVNWLTADIFSSPALSKVNDVAADAGILFSAATNSSAAPGAAIIASGDGSPRGAGRQRVSSNGNVVTVSRSPSAPSLLPPPPVNNHRSKATTATWCDEGYVDCEFGFVKGSDPAIKCAQACGTQCCVGFYACDRFTGKVCKDGNSCMGRIACGAANIPSVVKSCNGKQACYYVGGNSSAFGQVGRMENSCNWDYSCRFLGGGGFFLYRGGQISGPGKRDVGNVVNSCNGYTACEMAGENGGSIGNITNSCNAPSACIRLGHPEGSVGHVTDSCNDVSACARVGAQNGGSIGNITKSCNAPDACRLAGYNDCYGDDDGLFDDDDDDDHDDCWLSTSASSPSCGQVTSNLNECCNKADECLGKEEVDLPAECRFSTLKPTMQSPTTVKPTTKSPTAKPTTKSPTSKPTSKSPTSKPTTKSPTSKPTTKSPTSKPTSKSPTSKPTTKSPTSKPTTKSPTSKPTTKSPTSKPTTKSPTSKPTTKSPTRKPV